MLMISEKTVPFVTDSMAELMKEVAAHIAKGYFYFYRLRSHDDTAKHDLEVVHEIEKTKWEHQGRGIKPLMKYFRTGPFGLLLSTESSVFGPDSVSWKFDVRQRPIDFCEYRITCKQAGAGYEVGFSISPHFMELHNMTLTRPLHPAETVGRALKELQEVSSPQIIEQVESILNAANVKRRAAGVEIVSRASAGLPEAEVLRMIPPPDGRDQSLR